MYADLHIHSVHSDGTDTPKEIFSLAVENGINTIAITDHDCIDGVTQAHGFMNEYGTRLIDGVELSTLYEGNYVHVLGYYIDINSTALSRYIDESGIDKSENTKINFENTLSRGVISYDWERVVELYGHKKRLSGLHVVYAMEQDGYEVPGMTRWEFFRKYFLAFGEEFIDTEKKNPFDAIDVIKEAGGIPILAHPKLIGSDDNMMKFIEYGAMGLEVYHPSHSDELSEKFLGIAKERGLYITGGTDWHGKNSSPNITHFGMCGLMSADYDILKKL